MSDFPAIQGFSTQPTCPDTTTAFLYETLSSFGSQVSEQSSKAFENTVAFGNHYYQQLPSLTQIQGQIGEYKDAFLNTTSTGFEQAKAYTGQKLADASEKMGVYGETIKGYAPTAREKLVQAGEYVRQNLPDLNDPKTVEMIAVGAVTTTLALSVIYLAYGIYKINKEIEKDLQQYRELPLCRREADDEILEINPVSKDGTLSNPAQTPTWEVRVLSSDEAKEIDGIFWQMQKELDQMFTNFGNFMIPA